MSSNLDVGPFGGGNTAVFQDVLAAGSGSQSITNATVAVINFNTEIDGKPFISLSSNQFTIDEGVYDVTFMFFTSSGNRGNFWLEDTLGVEYGGAQTSFNFDQNANILNFRVKIPSGGKIVELKAITNGSPNMGNAYGSSDEYYQQIRFTKVG